MTITCPHCGASGNLDDSKRPVGATSIKCPRCSQGFPLPPPLPSVPPPDDPPPLRQCPACGGIIDGIGQLCSLCEAAKARQAENAGAAIQPPLPAAEKEQLGICSVCKGQFSQNEMVKFGERLVCAACKPTYMQMLSMGLAGSASAAEGTLGREELEARDYSVDIGGCLSAAWDMFKSNMGMVIGASALVYLSMAISNAIPILGYISALVLSGPFMGGIWRFYIKKMRGEDATINDAFSGFSRNFIQLMLVGAVTSLIYFVTILAGIVPFVMAIGLKDLIRGTVFSGNGASMAFIVPAGLFLLAAMGVITYLSVSWLYAIPLVIDKNMPFWPAMQLSRKMVDKHWWMTFLFLSVVGMVGSMGIILLIIGLVFTAPVAFAAMVAHYQNVFGDLKPE